MAKKDINQSTKAYQDSLPYQSAMSEARKRLVDLVFDTPDKRMSELTVIPLNLVFRLSVQVEREAALDPDRDPVTQPLSKIRRMAYFQLMRSVKGQHLIGARMLAESEMAIKEDEAAESLNL